MAGGCGKISLYPFRSLGVPYIPDQEIILSPISIVDLFSRSSMRRSQTLYAAGPFALNLTRCDARSVLVRMMILAFMVNFFLHRPSSLHTVTCRTSRPIALCRDVSSDWCFGPMQLNWRRSGMQNYGPFMFTSEMSRSISAVPRPLIFVRMQHTSRRYVFRIFFSNSCLLFFI